MQGHEYGQNAILSPVRLPFRHTGKRVTFSELADRRKLAISGLVQPERSLKISTEETGEIHQSGF
jgi:hypothetical protein